MIVIIDKIKKMKKLELKTILTPNSPVQFKKEVRSLLNELMKDYKVTGKDKDFETAFKLIFKSHLYYLIDNYFEVKNDKKKLSYKKLK